MAHQQWCILTALQKKQFSVIQLDWGGDFCLFFLIIILTPSAFSFCRSAVLISSFPPVLVLAACLCHIHRFNFSTRMSHSKGRRLLSCKICVSLSSVWQSQHLHGQIILGHIAKLSPEIRKKQSTLKHTDERKHYVAATAVKNRGNPPPQK